ncbi:methyltransferase domain protein [Aeromicrobium marinum DSM 15272]|uniref:Methyltransferase domain protein n=2 Tax=Aeromicrobium marinum TaxID=219314 RepID=E2SFQ6_9ACTN|nr:methyltransferase domain protein [Aeromicrobium marinum DSM 15272]
MMRDPKDDHWNAVYGSKADTDTSWYEPKPTDSLAMLDRLGVVIGQSVIDVGGGTSTLVDSLWGRGHRDLAVLDVSAEALRQSRERLGKDGEQVEWVVADLTEWAPSRRYDVWHDRAVFHFLTDPDARAAYLTSLRTAVQPGGAFVVATFALSGPEHCSGLPVARHSAEGLIDALGPGFEVIDQREIIHTTPWGSEQPFTWLGGRVVP